MQEARQSQYYSRIQGKWSKMRDWKSSIKGRTREWGYQDSKLWGLWGGVKLAQDNVLKYCSEKWLTCDQVKWWLPTYWMVQGSCLYAPLVTNMWHLDISAKIMNHWFRITPGYECNQANLISNQFKLCIWHLYCLRKANTQKNDI